MVFRRKKKNRLKTVSRKGQSFSWQIIKGTLRMLVVAVFLVCIYYFTRLPVFTITSIDIDGGETISHKVLHKLATAELDETYFRLIPRRFAYLYPHERIIDVLENIPRVHNVNILRSSGNTLEITFEEYVPYALWCSDLNLDTNTNCYFLDATGFAFDEAPTLSGGTFVRHFVSNNDDYRLGKVIGTDKLVRIDSFIKQVETVLNFRINSVTYMSEEDILFMINGGGKIFVSLKKDLTNTLENIAVVLNSKEFQHIEPGNFQYIDARFQNKIFVNENLLTATGTEKELSE